MINFDNVYDRKHTNSLKWDLMEKVYQIEDASDLLPMWVADMDFQAPKEVIEAITKRLQHPVLGYTMSGNSNKEAVMHWFEKRHKWSIEKESILFHIGVVPAIATIVEALTNVDDQVAVSTPVYPPFFNVPKNLQREVVTVDLNEQDNILSYNFETLEEAFKNGVKLYILCHPHNPGGFVWDRTTLERLIDLAIQYDVAILSDEIHADLMIDGYQHIPLLTLERAAEAKIITCIAPTKTFNIAGVQIAMMVAPNKDLRHKLQQTLYAHGMMETNIFGLAALEAVYTKGEAWLDALLAYLSKNMDYVIQELTELKGISIRKPQGTYLLWIDYRETGLSEKEMMHKLLHVGKLALEPGTKYGKAGDGFLRMNVACPFSLVEEGVARFKKALATL